MPKKRYMSGRVHLTRPLSSHKRRRAFQERKPKRGRQYYKYRFITFIEHLSKDLNDEEIELYRDSWYESLKNNYFNLDKRDQNGDSLLQLCVKQGHTSAVKLLIKLGANILIKDQAGNTLIHLAAMSNNTSFQLTTFLLSTDINASLPNKENDTPWELARRAGHHRKASDILMLIKRQFHDSYEMMEFDEKQVCDNQLDHAIQILIAVPEATINEEIECVLNYIWYTDYPTDSSGHDLLARMIINFEKVGVAKVKALLKQMVKYGSKLSLDHIILASSNKNQRIIELLSNFVEKRSIGIYEPEDYPSPGQKKSKRIVKSAFLNSWPVQVFEPDEKLTAIAAITSRFYPGNQTKNRDKAKKVIDKLEIAYNSNQYVRNILNVAALAALGYHDAGQNNHKQKYLKIIGISPRCLTPGYTTFGQYTNKNTVFVRIGAIRGPEQIMHTVVHELTHFVMLEVFKNGCYPYTENDREARDKLDGIIRNLKENLPFGIAKQKYAKIISDTYNNSYNEKAYPKEVIARLIEILAYKDGETWARTNIHDLYQFYKEHVEPSILQYLRNHSFLERIRLPKLDFDQLGAVCSEKVDKRHLAHKKIEPKGKYFYRTQNKCNLFSSPPSEPHTQTMTQQHYLSNPHENLAESPLHNNRLS